MGKIIWAIYKYQLLLIFLDKETFFENLKVLLLLKYLIFEVHRKNTSESKNILTLKVIVAIKLNIKIFYFIDIKIFFFLK